MAQSNAKPGAQVDPGKMLEDALRRSDALSGYTIPFYMRERTKPFDGMSDWGHIRAYYRKEPLAVKFVWLNKDSEYTEAVYVEGYNDNQVMARERRGFLGLPPRTVSIKPEAAVSWRKTIRPITDFGLDRLVRHTLQGIADAQRHGDVRIIYAGHAAPPDIRPNMETDAHHIVVHYPKGFAESNRQDVYISTQTGYPIATYFWRGDGRLLAAYLYGRPVPPAPPLNRFHLSAAST